MDSRSAVLAGVVLLALTGAALAQPAALVQPAAVGVLLEGAHAGHLLHMELKHVLALALGVAIGVQAVEWIGAGAELRLVGLIGGALLGETWYNENIWPFAHEIPWWHFW